jgi:O-antigen/teichoic acid export membrane protein
VWDVQNAPRNYLALLAYQAGSSILSFGAVWLLTQTLGSEGYGGIVALIAASQVAQVFINWTAVAVVRFGVDEFVDTQKIARTFWIRLIILAVNMALVLLAAELWFPPLSAWLQLSPDSFWLVLAHLAATATWIHFQLSFQAVKLPRLQGMLQMVERLLIFLSLITLFFAGGLSGRTALICYIASPAVMAAVGLVSLRHYIFSRFSVDRAFLKSLFTYSLPLAPMWLVGYFSGRDLDAIFITRYLSVSDLGIYSVATQITGIALQVPTLANQLLIPLFISLEKETQSHKTERLFRDVMPVAVLVWGLLCSLATLGSAYLIPPIFGPGFSNSIVPLWILMASTGIALPVMIGYSAYSHALSASYMSMFAAVFAAVTNVVFNFILIPDFGMVGCAWATFISIFVSVMTFGVLLRRLNVIQYSWLHLAMVPGTAGAAVISATGSPIASFAICAALTLPVAYLRKASIIETVRFSANLRK